MYSKWSELVEGRTKAILPKPSERYPMATLPKPGTQTKNTGKWAGRFMPKGVRRDRLSGMLGDDEWTGNTGPQPPQEDIQPIIPRETMTLPSIGVVSTPVSSSTVGSGGSVWDSLFGGLAKIVTPAAQALVGIKTNETVQRARQQALVNTWNPALTGPALQAQAYQSAFMSGSGASPISTTTLVVGGLVTLGLIMAMTRK